jgi:hypothetical protein
MLYDSIWYNINMKYRKCPQKGCNAPALLLLRLLCANPLCQNYDVKWHAETTSEPIYLHKAVKDTTFLGGFSYDNKYYDLYHSINPLDDVEWIEARYDNELSCYLASELLFAYLDESDVIVEAARRWNNRID